MRSWALLHFCSLGALSDSALARLWPFGEQTKAESLPIVQIKLGRPKNPLPEVAATIGLLSHSREIYEAAAMEYLSTVYKYTLADAKNRIEKMVSSTLNRTEEEEAPPPSPSFAGRYLRAQGSHAPALLESGTKELDDTAFGIKVSVVSVPPPDPAIEAMIKDVEFKRTTLEKNMFEEACDEMQGLTAIILNDFGKQLASHSAFLSRQSTNATTPEAETKAPVGFLQISSASEASKPGGLPRQANVRLASSDDAFPRVADLVQEMETARNNAEKMERASILEMEIKLVKAENDMIKEALRRIAH